MAGYVAGEVDNTSCLHAQLCMTLSFVRQIVIVFEGRGHVLSPQAVVGLWLGEWVGSEW